MMMVSYEMAVVDVVGTLLRKYPRGDPIGPRVSGTSNTFLKESFSTCSFGRRTLGSNFASLRYRRHGM